MPVTTYSYDSIAALRKATSYTTKNPDKIAFLHGYYERGDGGGNRFLVWDKTSEAKDNGGTIIKPNGVTGAGRWVQYVTDGYINALWFGLRPMIDYNNVRSNFDNSQRADDLLSVFGGYGEAGFAELHFPKTDLNRWYFSKPLVFRKSLRLRGAAGTVYMKPSLVFVGTKGLHIEAPKGYDGSTGTFDFMIEDLTIVNLDHKTYRPYDESKPGIWTNVKPHYKNVTVTGFPGNGITVSGNQGDKNYGNCNQFYMENITSSYNAGYGMQVGTSDVNASLINGIDTSNNGLGGIRDDSFLGMIYIAPHTNGNCHYGTGPEDNNHKVRCKVLFGGVYHYYISSKDSKGEKPLAGKDSAAWRFAGTGLHWGVNDWKAEESYLAGGAFIVTNDQAESWFVGAYAEDNGFHSLLASKAVILSSKHALPVIGKGNMVNGGASGLSSRFDSNEISMGNGNAMLLYQNGVFSINASKPMQVSVEGANDLTIGHRQGPKIKASKSGVTL